MTTKLVTNQRLAKFLLGYKPNAPIPNKISAKYKINPERLSNQQLEQQIADVGSQLRKYYNQSLANYKQFKRSGERIYEMREDKSDLIEHHHVYDKYLHGVLKEFCIMTIAFLVKLDRMHRHGLLIGNVSPYTMMYDHITKECTTCNIDFLLSDKSVVRAEKLSYGNIIYVNTPLKDIYYNDYLAPELKASLKVHYLQQRLLELLVQAEARELSITDKDQLNKFLTDFHQKLAKYTNRAEIYSAGYTLNQLLSHQLEKLAVFGLLPGEKISGEIPPEVIEEANALLPEKYSNHEKEPIIDLLNEAVEYIHDLMRDHIEQRDTLRASIDKFVYLLGKLEEGAPGVILEAEEPEGEEIEEKLAEEAEEKHAHEEEEAEHEEHEEHAEHGEHEEHEHEEHAEHEHEEHEEHAEHEHEHEEHEEHEHEEHEEHEHEEHEEHAEHEEHEHEEEHESEHDHGVGEGDHDDEHEEGEEEHGGEHAEHEEEEEESIYEHYEELFELNAHKMHILHEMHLHEEHLHEEHAHMEHEEKAAEERAEHTKSEHGATHNEDEPAKPHQTQHEAEHSTNHDLHAPHLEHVDPAALPPSTDPNAPAPGSRTTHIGRHH